MIASLACQKKLEFSVNLVTWISFAASHLNVISWCLGLNGPGQCRECLPDHEQDPTTTRGKELCASERCPFQKRMFGENTCQTCPDGAYYDDTLQRSESDPSSWVEDRCIKCPVGQYSKQNDFLAIGKCRRCDPGYFQPNTGSSQCLQCQAGSFQASPGKDACDPCLSGGYCDSTDTVNGGFTPCPPGTYNDKVGNITVELFIVICMIQF